jgi:hypothetical protein
MRNVAVLAIGGLAVLAVGCGNGSQDDGGTGNDAGQPADLSTTSNDDLADASVDLAMPDLLPVFVSWDQLAIAFATEFCNKEIACGRLGSGQLQSCITAHRPASVYDVDSETMKKHVQLNMTDCTDKVHTSRCDGEDTYPVLAVACGANLFFPAQVISTQCLANQECKAGYCAHVVTDGGTQGIGCPGVCTAFKSQGMPCSGDDNECNPAIAYCNVPDPVSAPNVGTCSKKAGTGEACSQVVPCAIGANCKGQYFDFFASDGTGTGVGICDTPTAGAAHNAPCDPQQGFYTQYPPCADPGDYCAINPGAGAAMGTLAGYAAGTTCQSKFATGAVCDPATAISDNQCADGTSCTAIDPASATDTAHKCRPRAGIGAFCVASSDCQDTLYCDTTVSPTHTCKAKAVANESCTSTPCLLGANHCISGTCAPFLEFGSTCTTDQASACSTGACSTSCVNICQ